MVHHELLIAEARCWVLEREGLGWITKERDSSSPGDFRNADPLRQAVFCPFYRRDLRL